MNPNACQCPRCALVEQILDHLTEAGAIDTAARRVFSALRVREWVGKGYALECVKSATARALAGRAAEGSRIPINLGLVEKLMQGGRYVPLSTRYPAACPFTHRAGELPYRAEGHGPLPPARPTSGDASGSRSPEAP